MERPIFFSAPMVKAIIAGRKTMTRQLAWRYAPDRLGEALRVRLPSLWQCVAAGDRLWVRESLVAEHRNLGIALGISEAPSEVDLSRGDVCAAYAADGAPCLNEHEFDFAWVWQRKRLPSIHMPRAFCRITLEVTAVKIERLCRLTDDDAVAEGIERGPCGRDGCYRDYSDPDACVTPVDSFVSLWNSLHGEGAWAANPEVVAISFTRRP